MGYTHGEKWTEEKIEEEIKKYIETNGADHFPSQSELINFFGNNRLVCAIARNGGISAWSSRFNIPSKNSETSFGNNFENIAIEEIRENVGLDAEYTNARYPYDILVDRSVKVDVKTSKLYHTTEYGNGCFFNIEKKDQTCDVFIFYCLDDNFDIYKRLIIPSTTLSGQTQVGIGQQSKWNCYIDRWDIIKEHADFFSQYKVRPEGLKEKKRLPPPKAIKNDG